MRARHLPQLDGHTIPTLEGEESRTMTGDEESGIGCFGEGPTPSSSHDTWCHRCEGIGRRFLVRKNRNKKKEKRRNTKNIRHSSCHGNPFRGDRTTCRDPALPQREPVITGCRNGGGGNKHLHRRSRPSVEGSPQLVRRSHPCQGREEKTQKCDRKRDALRRSASRGKEMKKKPLIERIFVGKVYCRPIYFRGPYVNKD